MHKLMHVNKINPILITHTPHHTTHPPPLQPTMMNSSSPSSPFTPLPQTNLLSLLSQIQLIELLLAALVFVAIRHKRRRHDALPSWPLVGMLPSLLLGLRTGNIYAWLTDVLLRQKNETRATFVFRGPHFTNLHCVVTADPRNLEHLLKAKFPNFPKGGYFRDTLRDLLGDGIFNADGDTWQRQRKTASLEFHSARFRRMTIDSMLELVHARLLPVLLEGSLSSRAIDLQDILLRLTFDNVCMIAFGVDPGCLRPGLPEVPFARAFEAATEAAFARFVTPTLVWKAMRRLGAGSEGRLRESIRGVDEFAWEVIRARKRELNKDGCERVGSDLLTVFVGMKDEEGKEMFTERFLRDICVNFILAGRDTSSVALSWFFWLVDGNRGVEERILEEMRGVVRERGGGEGGGGELVFRPEEVKRMDYLHAALTEALRLYPSVPVDHKEVLEDDEFPDGTILKKGTKVVYAIYAMGRMESIWGKDCGEFKPERWLRSDGRFMGESAYKFTAFNGGPRLCLGKDFAYYQMKFVAASILYRYRVEVVESHPVVPKMALTMYMKHGLKVVLRRREPLEIEKCNIKNKSC